ncbi:MAG: CoA transferase [Dehalococcoidia bacterium]
MSNGFLAGTRVIEWGEALTAPFCGKLLADLGAQVIKIEPLPGGDAGRGLPPFAGGVPGRQRSLLFAHLNAGKRGVALDLATAPGRELLHALFGEADALIEDRPLAQKEAMGFTYERLHADYPSLVVTSVSPYGQTGPYRDYHGYPSVSFHMSGAGYVTPPLVQSSEQPPLSLPGRPAAISGGLAAAAGTQMALLARRFDGRGRHVDVAEVESMLAMMATPINRYAMEGRVEKREERSTGLAPFAFFPVKDGYVSIFLVQEAHWRRLVAMMGDPDWADNELFADRRARAQYLEDVTALMHPWLSQQRKEELYAQAQALDIPIGPAHTMDDVLADDHFAHRGVFHRGSHPAFGPMTYLQPPYRASRGRWSPPSPAPGLGEHTRDVLMSWLGLSRREVAALAAAGVV